MTSKHTVPDLKKKDLQNKSLAGVVRTNEGGKVVRKIVKEKHKLLLDSMNHFLYVKHQRVLEAEFTLENICM